MHRDQVVVARRAGEVVALERRGDGQHDVGVLCQRVPEDLVHDHGLGPLPGAHQPVEVLVVVERVAAGPPDQPDVGVGQPLAVEVEGLARVQQHVADPRHRDEAPDRVAALRQGRPGERADLAADPVDGGVAEAEAAARQADLPEHRGERDRQPVGLLAMVGALDRPAHRDQGARRRHVAGERADKLGVDAGDRGRPGGVLGLPIAVAHEVGLEPFEADRVAVEERAVVEPFRHQRMAEAEHEGGVRARPQRQPLGIEDLERVLAQGAQEDEARAARLGAQQMLLDHVPAHPARVDLGVLQRHSAEHQHQIGVLGDRGPGGVPTQQAAAVADDARHDHLGGGVGVGVDRAGVAADAVEETVELALGVVEAAGARPAVGAAEDRGVAVGRADPFDLGRDEVECGIPVDLDERLGASSRRHPPRNPSRGTSGVWPACGCGRDAQGWPGHCERWARGRDRPRRDAGRRAGRLAPRPCRCPSASRSWGRWLPTALISTFSNR